MWYKIYADGSEIDIIYANDEQEAMSIAHNRHGDAVYTWKYY
jgi:hypothetical protein